MAININIPKPVIDYNDLDNKPTLVTDHSQLNLDDGTNPHGTTASDVGAVPYTGASGNVDLGEFGIDTGFVQFDTTPTNTPTTQGALSWDTDDNTLQLVMNGSIMKVGEDQYYPVKNQTGVAIAKGTAVRFAGTVGSSGRLLIAPYIADGSVANSVFMGVTSETIDDGEDGKVMWFGRIRGINTNAFNEGDVLYASPTTAGAFTTVPNNKVQVCAVVTKSINNGVIFVRPSIFPTASEVGAVPETRTINGLDLSANRTLTTANINDSTDRRYVTDAQLTVIGNTSGTNTGDETQSSILSKLGWFTYNRVAESTAVTGTTAETIIENITIPENTFVNGGIIRSYNNKFRKVGNSGTLAIRLYIGPTANNLTGATLVGSFTGIIASQNYAEMLRTFTATTSGILGFSATQSIAVDTTNSSAGRLSASIDWTVNQYFMVTVQLGNSGDSVSMIGASLKNF